MFGYMTCGKFKSHPFVCHHARENVMSVQTLPVFCPHDGALCFNRCNERQVGFGGVCSREVDGKTSDGIAGMGCQRERNGTNLIKPFGGFPLSGHRFPSLSDEDVFNKVAEIRDRGYDMKSSTNIIWHIKKVIEVYSAEDEAGPLIIRIRGLCDFAHSDDADFLCDDDRLLLTQPESEGASGTPDTQ